MQRPAYNYTKVIFVDSSSIYSNSQCGNLWHLKLYQHNWRIYKYDDDKFINIQRHLIPYFCRIKMLFTDKFGFWNQFFYMSFVWVSLKNYGKFDRNMFLWKQGHLHFFKRVTFPQCKLTYVWKTTESFTSHRHLVFVKKILHVHVWINTINLPTLIQSKCSLVNLVIIL